MSLTAESMTPADIAACTGGNCNSGWGNGNFGEWIILFLIFGMFGWNNNNGGFFGGGGNSGAADNYVLTSDFSQLSRQISDSTAMTERKLDSITNGICSLGYDQLAQMNGINQNVSNGFYNTLTALTTNGYESRLATQGLGSQMSQCCCDIREGISGVNYNAAMNANATQRAISDGFCQTNYNMATQNNATMVAIDKVGDRIIDYLANEKAQTLRDENQALRLAASQQAQNNYLISQLGQKCPQPAYVVQPPQSVSFPTNCCGNASYGSSCGCGI